MKCQHSLRHYWNFLVNLRGKKFKHRRWSGNSTLKLLRIKAGAGNVNTSQTQPFPPVPSAPPRPPSACFLGRNSGRPRKSSFRETCVSNHQHISQFLPAKYTFHSSALLSVTATPSSTLFLFPGTTSFGEITLLEKMLVMQEVINFSRKCTLSY